MPFISDILYNFHVDFWGSLATLTLILLGMYIALRMLISLGRMFHAIYESRQHVYLKVILPRTDNKNDQNQTKADEFKEKIAVMESIYRSIYEIQDLNLKNHISTLIWNNDFVSFELVYENKLVHFYVVTHPHYAELLHKQITSFYPNAEVTEVPGYEIAPKGKKTKGFFLYLSKLTYFPLRTYKQMGGDPLNELTNVFSKLGEKDIAAIQIRVDPKGDDWEIDAKEVAEKLFKKENVGFYHRYLSRIPLLGFFSKVINGFFSIVFKGEAPMDSMAPGASHGDAYIRMLASEEEILKTVGEKANQEGFETTIRVMASSDTKAQASKILDAIVLAFNVFSNQGSNWLENRRVVPVDAINTPWMLFNFRHRLPGYGEKTSIMVPDELSSLYHLPSSRFNETPIIKWLDYKILPPPNNIPSQGILMGYNTYQSTKTPIYISPDDRARHLYIIGKSGAGKSVLLSYMARQDIAQGNGCAIIDPHGDLIEDVLKFIPKNRVKDVIVFDPSNMERPMGLNMLEATSPEQMDMASSQATEIFIKLFGDEIFGPRIQHYFRNACLTLMEDQEDGATLIDVPRIFVDEEFMKYKVAKVKNPVVKSFWEHEYASTGERERQEMIPYFSAKFGPFITNNIMRNTIGQPKSAFNFRECMDQGKILLINLSKGKMGDLNTQLLGLVCVSQLQMAAMSRVDLPEKERRPFYLYVDEFQSFATESFCSILSEARKYGLALTMAHQYIGQLTVTKFGHTTTAIRDAVFGNAGTLVAFKIGAEDADYMAKEFAPVLGEQDVINIANYKAYVKLSINNAPSRPFSMETIYDIKDANPKAADIVKKYSSLIYGRDIKYVDAEIADRIGFSPSSPSEAPPEATSLTSDAKP